MSSMAGRRSSSRLPVNLFDDHGGRGLEGKSISVVILERSQVTDLQKEHSDGWCKRVTDQSFTKSSCETGTENAAAVDSRTFGMGLEKKR
jgi:hypothetical protein